MSIALFVVFLWVWTFAIFALGRWLLIWTDDDDYRDKWWMFSLYMTVMLSLAAAFFAVPVWLMFLLGIASRQ